MNKIEFDLKEKCGIYMIVNLVNGKKYVGSSVDIYNRLHEHLHNLKNRKAHNVHLQASWDKYGEDKFIYSLLEYCNKSIQFEREQYYIDVLKPEYNLTSNVVANTGHKVTEETKKKISDTLKKKYASGEITTYKQEHNWKKCYIYNIRTLKLESICDCGNDALALLHSKKGNVSDTNLYNNRYCVSYNEIKSPTELLNYINQRFLVANSKFGKYIICQSPNGDMKYYRTLVDCARDNFSSKSTLNKHSDASKDNPYIIKQTGNKFFYSDEYFPVVSTAVHIEESYELRSGNIGGSPEMENTEINSEIAQGSESSYSVESE